MSKLLRLPHVLALTAMLSALLFGAHASAQHHGSHKTPGVISLDVYRDGALLHLLTVEADTKKDARRLWYRQSHDGGRNWGAPVRVDNDAAAVYDLTRGNDAQIAATGKRLLAVWTVKGSGHTGSGPLASAVSRDGGKTWQPGGSPADDNSTAGHAYSELIAAKGVFDAVWLDSRDGAQGLRHARSRDGVRWEKNVTVQAKTCECCWQSLLQREGALWVMYRGNRPRDMALSVLPKDGTAWEARGRVGKFDWDFKGCPHTGGALAAGAGAKTLHATVWTGAQAAQGLHHVISHNGGVSWHLSQRLGTQDAQRADIAVSDDGKSLAAVWDQLEGSRRLIYAAFSADRGSTWSPAQRLSANDVDAVYPRVVHTHRGFLVLWTEIDGGGAHAASVLKTAVFDPLFRRTR